MKPIRALMPDYLRLVALFGIVIVNVQFIGFSSFSDTTQALGHSVLDQITLWFVNGVALMKTFGLFSFMFGVGLGLLMRSAQRGALPFGRLYRNRMIGLFILGVLHGCFFFMGDILVTYALMGSILYFFRNFTPPRLVKIGAILLVLAQLVGIPLLLIPVAEETELLRHEENIRLYGTFFEVVGFNSLIYVVAAAMILFLQGMAALGWFCLGLAAVKAGMIDDAQHPLWRKARRYLLFPGLILSLFGAAIWQWGPSIYGVGLTIAIAPIVTLGYLGAIAGIARAPKPFMATVLQAGGSSLSIYLGQSIVLAYIFSGYGLGLWGRLDYFWATMLAIGVTMLLIMALAFWRRWFKYGPFEAVLRRITYFGMKPTL